MLLRRFTDIYPKELARDMREFFNSLLGECSPDPDARPPLRAAATRKISTSQRYWKSPGPLPEWERPLRRECARHPLPLRLRRSDDSYSNLEIELIDVFLSEDMRRPEENLAAVNDFQLA